MNTIVKTVQTAVTALALIPLWSLAADTGTQIAERLTQQFNDTRAQCESPTGPSFECSGTILRGTVYSSAYYSWNPLPNDKRNGAGGVSFAFLRADSQFSWLPNWIENGFILFPPRETPEGRTRLTVLCYFPVDGWTNERTEKGCGGENIYNAAIKAAGAECSTQGITTAEAWKKKYDAANSNPKNISMCSFSMINQSPEQEAAEFAQALKVRSLATFEQNDEFRIASWPQNIPEQLPIEAFFFLTGKPNGLKGAQQDQLDFYRQTGEVVPVIELSLQAGASKSAGFSYREAQQADLKISGCARYIQSATWGAYTEAATKRSGWQLKITPTDCARSIPEAETNAAYAELTRKYGADTQWQWRASGTDSMRRQFVCLLANYPKNDTWNIETFRPYVDAVRAKALYCNP